jgi:Major Facilitator Superfamily
MAIVALVASLLMYDRPSDLNLPLYGESKITPRPAEGVGLVSLLMAPLNVLKDAARVPIFWVLFGTFFVCGCSTNGLIQTHFVTLCHDYGLPAVTAASVLAMMGIFDFFGTIGSGWLSDRFDNRWLLFWYYGLRGLSLLYLPFTDFNVLRPFAVRCVLRSRLDRHRTADRETDGRPLRPGEGRHGVRMGVRRPSDRRRQCGVRRRFGTYGIFDLSAGLLRRRRALPHRGGTCSDGAKTVGAGNRHGRAGARLRCAS